MTAGTGIRHHALLACEPFSARLDAVAVASALAAGLTAAGAPDPDAVELPGRADDREAAALLERAGFHARMLASRARPHRRAGARGEHARR